MSDGAFKTYASAHKRIGYWKEKCSALEDRIRELEQRLAAVEGLLDKWRSWLFDSSANGLKGPDDCADELQAALRPQQQED